MILNEQSLQDILGSYDPTAPLAQAWTPPAAWYVDPRIFKLERRTVFSGWQIVGRLSQVAEPGQYFTIEVAGEPLLIVRGRDGILRGFFNVCRHHAAAVMTQAAGQAAVLRCPYHGWTYALDGTLHGTPDFDGVCNFDRGQNGLVPIELQTWEQFVGVRLTPAGPTLAQTLGGFADAVTALGLAGLHFIERRTYIVEANWKVYIDNYLDGSYHVPHIHKGLSSVLDYAKYTIENGPHYCLQKSPLVDAAQSNNQTGNPSSNPSSTVATLRPGTQAAYYWLYPNFMINWYQGTADTNLVLPLGVDRTQVIFDIYAADVSAAAQAHNQASADLIERIQEEDRTICESVQRGLRSRAYEAGRLSVRREAGEHLFHRLLSDDLRRALPPESR